MLFAAACPLFLPDEPSHNIPPGMGSFSLRLSGNVSRTILPATPDTAYFTSYELAFTAVSGGANNTVTRTNTNLTTDPVALVPGTYNLTVTAFAGTPAAARGTLTGIVVNLGENTTGEVLLKLLLAEGTGTFSWNITFPGEVTSATMTIRNPAGVQQGENINLTSGTSANRELPSGVYNITINLINSTGNRAIVWYEVLHIYSTLTSNFTKEFLEMNFYQTHYVVGFENINGNDGYVQQTILHGDTVSAPAVPDRPGWFFGGWYENGIFTNPAWDFNTQIINDFNLIARWCPVAVTAGASTGYFDTLEDALASITTAGTYTVRIGQNQQLAGHEWNGTGGSGYLAVNDANITLESAAAVPADGVTVQLSSNGYMFTMNTGVTLTLTNGVTLRGRKAPEFSANDTSLLWVRDGGIFNMSGGAITGNSSQVEGGAIYVDGTFNMQGGTISGNESDGASAGGLYVDGTFTMSGGTISNNRAGGDGGGVFVVSGEFTMSGGVIGSDDPDFGNTASNRGGGVCISNGIFNMTGGEIKGNNSNYDGGGVLVGEGNFTMSGGEISGNKGHNGGGVFVDDGEFTMEGTAIIRDNISDTLGGGISTNSGNVIIRGNALITLNESGADEGGGGICIGGGSLSIEGNAVISNNTSETIGGGVAFMGYGSFNMTGGEISDNYALNSNGGGGGGGVILITNITFNMSGGTISGNTATTGDGGGVLVGQGTFAMSGTAEISNNTAVSGGGVYVASGGTFNMLNGEINDNTATATSGNVGGGGVYVSTNSARFNMSGGTITANNLTNAAANGGGVRSWAGVVTLGGNAKIFGNTRVGVVNNIHIANDTTIILGTGTAGNGVTVPTTGMEVWVQTARTDGVIVQNGASAVIANYFRADDPNSGVIYKENAGQHQLVIINTGSGTVSDPFIITTEAQLRAMISQPLNSHYRLEADIKLSSENWTAIGVNAPYFTGTFDGNGHTITGLTMTGAPLNYQGMFGVIAAGGVVKNLGLIDVDIYITALTIGSIAGTNEVGGSIENCYVTGIIRADGMQTSNIYVGGIVGQNFGLIKNCFVTASVIGHDRTGGITGETGAGSNITQNIALNPSVTGGNFIGRVVGNNPFGTLSNNYAWDGMTGRDNLVITTGIGLNTVHGESITRAQIKTKTAWETSGFNFTAPDSPWEWHPTSNDYMPRLRGETTWREWPEHLQPPLGSEENPFLITTEAQLRQVGTGAPAGWTLGAHYRLTANITLSGSWTPIGNDTNRFTGGFDGNGHAITGLTITGTANSQGMFGVIGVGGIVKNLGLVNVNISGYEGVGGAAGTNRGMVQNCYTTGNINGGGGTGIGGVVGYNFAEVSNSYSTCNIIGGGGEGVGGIAGSNYFLAGDYNGVVSNSYFTGSISGNNSVGGIVGYNEGAVINTYSTGNVTGTGNNVGGIVGRNNNSASSVQYNYATGIVSGGTIQVGGIVGYNERGSVQYNVALNSSLVRTAGTSTLFGRVTGASESTRTGNRARVDMIMPSDITVQSNIDGNHGADVALGTPLATVFAGWSGTVWNIPSDNLAAGGTLPTLHDVGGTQNPQVTINPQAGITLTFEQLSNQAPMLTDITISRSGTGAPTTQLLTMDTPEQYTSISWMIGSINSTASSFTLVAANLPISSHFLTLIVFKDGVPHSRTITVEVRE
jgi:uncharacterized repeat protein (TIGR02543 family)